METIGQNATDVVEDDMWDEFKQEWVSVKTRHPKPTWMYYLNYYVLCWSGFRLARKYDTDSGKYLGMCIVGPMSPFTLWKRQ